MQFTIRRYPRLGYPHRPNEKNMVWSMISFQVILRPNFLKFQFRQGGARKVKKYFASGDIFCLIFYYFRPYCGIGGSCNQKYRN